MTSLKRQLKQEKRRLLAKAIISWEKYDSLPIPVTTENDPVLLKAMEVRWALRKLRQAQSVKSWGK